MNTTTLTKLTKKKFDALLGLKGLESHVDQETFVYILRSVYGIVFRSSELNENKEQLKRRIRKFEEQSNLPGFMSTVSVKDLLTELEDAQYFYPVRRREVTLPTFH